MAESNGRKESPLYINVSVFGRQAEICKEYLGKGRQVAVVGQLRFREWENDEGQKRSEHTIAADRVDFLPGGGGGGGGGKRRSGGEGGGREGGGREES
jgi:single-strand DNA-binding protein